MYSKRNGFSIKLIARIHFYEYVILEEKYMFNKLRGGCNTQPMNNSNKTFDNLHILKYNFYNTKSMVDLI